MLSSLASARAHAGTWSGAPCGASAFSHRALSGVSPSGRRHHHSTVTEGSMADKQKLVREADEAFGELREAISGLDEPAMRKVWLGTWGAREILIPLSGWHSDEIP